MKKEEIHKFAQSIGADGAEYITDWRDFNVYTPTYKDDQMPIIGPPQFILVSGETIKLASPDEAFEFIDYEVAKEGGE